MHLGVKPQPSSSRSSPWPVDLQSGKKREKKVVWICSVNGKIKMICWWEQLCSKQEKNTCTAKLQFFIYLAYLAASRPSLSLRIAGLVPSMGSHRRLIGGRIWVDRYHSKSNVYSPEMRAKRICNIRYICKYAEQMKYCSIPSKWIKVIKIEAYQAVRGGRRRDGKHAGRRDCPRDPEGER